MTKNGFVKLQRSIVDWGWYQDEAVFRVFIHLLLTANYTEHVYRGVKVLPGQVITGRKALAEATGLTESRVRTAMDKLKSTGEITVKTMGQFSLVTLTGWAKHQGADGSETYANSPSKSPKVRRDFAKDSPHYKNIENDKKEEKYTPTHAKGSKAPSSKPRLQVYETGDYDYDAIRKNARERIRRIIAGYDISHSA